MPGLRARQEACRPDTRPPQRFSFRAGGGARVRLAAAGDPRATDGNWVEAEVSCEGDCVAQGSDRFVPVGGRRHRRRADRKKKVELSESADS